MGVAGELNPVCLFATWGRMGSIASHLVTRYFSVAISTEDAIARLDNVSTSSITVCLSKG